jgi:phosphate transport system substrate-binding protein
MPNRFATAVVAAAATMSLAVYAQSASLKGAGGTAIYPVMSSWADRYAKESSDTVIYQPIGSGNGIKQIESKAILFANTDMPLKSKDVASNKLVQFPLVIISISPVVHLSGISPGDVLLDGATLADIYLGKIKEWDGPRLKKSILMSTCRTWQSPQCIVPTHQALLSISPTIFQR